MAIVIEHGEGYTPAPTGKAAHELARLTNDTYVGGMLSRKGGVESGREKTTGNRWR